MDEVVRPNAWVALKLPSENTKVLQVIPNTTISLGKYGSFPSNLIIDRPYHLTYELQDKKPDEQFSRLRIVPPSELYADVFADEGAHPTSCAPSTASPEDDSNRVISAAEDIEYSLVDADTNAVLAQSNRMTIDDAVRQTLTQEEIEALKRDGAGAGRDLIAKLMLSHTALDQKTAFSLAKYKLLKTKKYIRRFTVLPMDVANFGSWQMEQKDAGKILELREEMVGLVGCWANIHFGGQSVFFPESEVMAPGAAATDEASETTPGEDAELLKGRWLIVDDTGGFLTAAMAERMGVLHPTDDQGSETTEGHHPETRNAEQDMGAIHDGARPTSHINGTSGTPPHRVPLAGIDLGEDTTSRDRIVAAAASQKAALSPKRRRKRPPRHDDFHIPFSTTNTLTLITSSNQPNLTFLKFFGYDSTNPDHPPHPLATHLLPITWLQLLNPSADLSYSTLPPSAPATALATWKANRRGNYHRKRRRWARTQHVVHTTRAGNFAGLAVASAMDAVGILQHTLPLLVGGAPIAVYSPTLEPLTHLADCFSVARRAAWTAADRPAAAIGRSLEELERWEGSEEFPVNPMLVVGAGVQTSRVRRWQVLPGRTHPVMTGRGGAEGYVFTGWRAKPAEGRVEARGKFKRRKVEGVGADVDAEDGAHSGGDGAHG